MFIHFICLLLRLILCGAQNQSVEPKFDNKSLYIFCSGSKTKSGLIAEQFNIRNRNATHVGVGFVQDHKLVIYNVTDTKNRDGSALVIDDFESFSANTVYISVWKCTISKPDLARLKKNCASYLQHKVKFDYKFTIADDDNFYCSEFCVKMLRLSNPEKFNFSTTAKPLGDFYRNVLQRDTLIYYPVDFFTDSRSFSKIYERSF